MPHAKQIQRVNSQQTADEILRTIEQEKIVFVRLQFVDILGSPKNLVIPTAMLDEAFDDGIPFDASSIVGCAVIEDSDKVLRIDPASFSVLPASIEPKKTARFTCDIYDANGKRFPGDVKYVLEQMVHKAQKLGYQFNTGSECEFFLFKKNGLEPTMIPHDGAGYFDLSHRDLAEGVRGDIALALQQLGLNIYTTHHEVAPGQQEINFQYADAVTTADRIITLKYVSKIIASQHDLHASFMPKPLFGTNGSGMHTHQSFFTAKGENAFYDPDDKHKLSELAYQFIAGQLMYVREMCAILNPTVNSFKRLVPGYEAPTYISWANQNRSALIRIPAKRGKATRCELRNPDVACNPYLAYAVMLAAGLKGIEDKLEAPEPVEHNIYELTAKEREAYHIQQLPESLGHALHLMEESTLVKEALGDHVYENFLEVKHKEWAEYQMQVTRWELDRYFPDL